MSSRIIDTYGPYQWNKKRDFCEKSGPRGVQVRCCKFINLNQKFYYTKLFLNQLFIILWRWFAHWPLAGFSTTGDPERGKGSSPIGIEKILFPSKMPRLLFCRSFGRRDHSSSRCQCTRHELIMNRLSGHLVAEAKTLPGPRRKVYTACCW